MNREISFKILVNGPYSVQNQIFIFWWNHIRTCKTNKQSNNNWNNLPNDLLSRNLMTTESQLFCLKIEFEFIKQQMWIQLPELSDSTIASGTSGSVMFCKRWPGMTNLYLWSYEKYHIMVIRWEQQLTVQAPLS